MAFDNQGDAVWRAGDRSAIALIDVGDGTNARSFSYADLDRMSDAVGRGLLARGLERGDRVAILAANSAEYFFSFLGTMRAGLVAVPVNYKLPAATVAYVLEDCDAKLVLADRPRLPLVPADVPKVVFGDAGAGGFDALLDAGPFTPADVAPGDPALFLYTSGSTGRPKGVILSHRSHSWVIEVRGRRPGPLGQRSLVAAPLYHMNGLAICQVTVAYGDTIVLLPGFTVAGYLAAAERYRVNNLTSVPTMIAMLLREPALLARTDLSSVTSVRMGSAPITQAFVDQVRQAFPGRPITNGYGTTEAGPIVFGPHPDGIPQPELSVGYPHPQVQLRLVADGKPSDVEGVLEMKCPAVMTGYHKLPEATAKAMTPDGFYRTGDVFRRGEHGFHYFVGRADDMFVCGGENIYPGEVEKMLERHPQIHQAAVIPVADELKGHKPVAFVVPRGGAVLDEQAVKTYALANAPAYQHPRRVWFMSELPLAGTNKIDRKALAEIAAAEPITGA
jgi:long-chain acyl-CoA synthetase